MNKLREIEINGVLYEFKDPDSATLEYVDRMITLITETGIPKLVMYPLNVEATSEGQTVFPINLEIFEKTTDTVLVQSGVTMLAPERDFTVGEHEVTLLEGVPLGRTLCIYVFKNVPLGEDGSIHGKVIAEGTMDLNRLTKMPITRDGMLTGTLLASGWSSTAPYTQTVNVEGILDGDRPTIGKGTPTEMNTANIKALNKAWGMVDDHEINDGSITFYCYTKKPTVDIPLLIKI